MKRFWSGIAAALIVSASFSAFGHADEAKVSMKGHVVSQIRKATKLDKAPADEKVSLSLVVRLDDHLLQQTLNEIYGPKAPAQKHFLSSAEFSQKFGLADKRQKLKDFAKANGWTLETDRDRPENMVVKVSGNVGLAEKTFGVKLYHYRDAKGKIFRAHEEDPTVPASLAPHLGAVTGLSNVTGVAHPHFRSKPISQRLKLGKATIPTTAASPSDMTISGGTGFDGTLAPQDIKSIYGLSQVSQNGAGQTVAVFELDGYNPTDITAYESQFSLPNVPTTFLGIDGTPNLCGGVACNQQNPMSDGGMIEVALDIEMMAALAPGVSNILVYDDANTIQGVLNTYNQIAVDDAAQVVSTSWGISEADVGAALSSESQIFQRMAVQGQTIYAASGDNGAYGNESTTNANDPASQPYVMAVGGTSLSGSIQSPVELAWSGSGGGVSGTWALPNYQHGVAGTASQQFRNVPDVALNADPDPGYGVYVAGAWYHVGGTSAAAPLWAAFTALLNQEQQTTGNGMVGFANPSFYQLGTGGNYHIDFRDIGAGSNGSFNAAPGYDNVTGWGSFKGSAMISPPSALAAAISGPLSGQSITSVTSITATANGKNFASYTLDYAAGVAPAVWTVLAHGSQAVTNGVLATFDPSVLPSGSYTIRLTAFDGSGHTAVDSVSISSLRAYISSPVMPQVPTPTLFFKPGVVIPIVGGTVSGSAFQYFRLDWGLGLNPTEWSNQGISLTGGGSAPVSNGTLGTWNTQGITQAGYYVIRLQAQYSNGLEEVRTVIYLEPDLAPGWPITLQGVTGSTPVILTNSKPALFPVPDAGGHLHLIGATNLFAWQFSPNGNVPSTKSINSGGVRPGAAIFQPSSGGELVTDDSGQIRRINLNSGSVSFPIGGPAGLTLEHSLIETDLDGDGVPEVLVQGFVPPQFFTHYLFAFHSSGSVVSTHFPIVITNQSTTDCDFIPTCNPVLPVDLDHTGQKTIFFLTSEGALQYRLKAFASDGSPLPARDIVVQGGIVHAIAAADLDHNGQIDIIVASKYSDGLHYKVDVFLPTGVPKPGWPVLITPPPAALEPVTLAIGDLDGGSHEEIVVAGTGFVDVRHSDGSEMPGWPVIDSVTHYYVLIHDLDGDGFPEIIATTNFSQPNPFNPMQTINDTGISSWHRDGSLFRQWQLLIPPPPSIATYPQLTVGDFHQNGTTDIAYSYYTPSTGGFYDSATFGILSLNTPFHAGPWPTLFHDTANTSVGTILQPVITSASNTTATVGSTFIYQITATNGPTGFNATGLPSGLTINTQTGVISGIPTVAGANTIMISATNAGGTGTAQLVLTINTSADQITLWPPMAAAAIPLSGSPGSPVEVGTRFLSNSVGYISALRFYKGAGNTGTHIGSLWDANGNLLAQATFINETASGWQQVTLSTPISIQANTVYTVSYFSPNGYFAYDQSYFATTGVNNPPLLAPQDGTNGHNGVYAYTSSPVFPAKSSGSNNYWADVVFTPAQQTNTLWPPTAAATVPLSGSPGSPVEVGTRFLSNSSGYISALRFYKGAGNTGTHVGSLWDTNGNLLGRVTFTNETVSGWQQVNLSAPIPIQANTVYTVSYFSPNGYFAYDQSYFAAKGVNNSPLFAPQDGTNGHNGVYAYTSSPVFPANSWSSTNYWADVVFTPVQQTKTIWPPTAVAAVPMSGSPSAPVEVGTRFLSNSSGYISALRFYKGTGNTGTHIGHLWDATGNSLAQATFTNETASGWQQVNLSAPVPIQVNTVYTVSYFSPNGYFAYDQSYFATTGVNNPPLLAPQDGTNGRNGVYAYSSSPVFPTDSWNSTNYWADIVFSANLAAAGQVAQPITLQPIPNAGGELTTETNALDNIRVYPNPWRAARGDHAMTFDQMPAGSTVKIFTVSARLVTILEAPKGSVSWPLTNDSGDKVASGIYLYLITDSQGNKTHGKFTIIK